MEPSTTARKIRWRALEGHPRLRRVREHLEQHLPEPFSLGAAARVAELNPKYLSMLFHRTVGVRFIDWLHIVRTESAKSLLSSGVPVTESARLVGYNSLRTFERAFMKYHALTARDFRQRCRTGFEAPLRPDFEPVRSACAFDLASGPSI